jgi:hypothetical protein
MLVLLELFLVTGLRNKSPPILNKTKYHWSSYDALKTAALITGVVL